MEDIFQEDCFLEDVFHASVLTKAGLQIASRAYAAFGGVPAYLDVWRDGVALPDMIQSALLTPGELLFAEADELLRTEFHQATMYMAILRAITFGQVKPSDIARAAGKPSADDIFPYLRRLIELRLVRREAPVTEWDQVRPRATLYWLDDPYLRFWFRYVSPTRARLQLGGARRVWDAEIAPTLNQFVAATTWESVCQQGIWRQVAAGSLPVDLTHLGRWWDNTDAIDLVGHWQGDVRLVGECKWTNEPVGETTLVELQRKAAKLSLRQLPIWVLASRSGFTPELRQLATTRADLALITPDRLYEVATATDG